MSYVINVGRVHLVNKWIFIGVPLLIMGSALAIVIIIGALLVPGDERFFTGAGQAPLWYFLIAGIQALTLTFPFSQGMSITRRNFFVGTTLTFAFVALGFAAAFLLLGFAERATDGWFVNGWVFALPWVTSGAWYETLLLVWAVTYALFMIGLWSATIYMRWRVSGVLVAFISLAVLLLGAASIVTFTESWSLVSRWFAAQTPLSATGWGLLLIAVLGIGSFLTLRRATP